MKKFLKKIAMVLSVVMVLSLVACGGEKKKASDSAGGKKTIGYVINNLNDTFQIAILNTAKEFAEKNNIELKILDSKEDVITQLDAVNSLIEDEVDGIVVVPVDTSGMDPITKVALENNLPLSYLNRNPYAGKEDTIPDGIYYVGAPEKAAGEMQMKFIGDAVGGKGGICILQGKLGNEGAIKRTEGVEEIAAKDYPDIKILAKESGNWNNDEGLKLTENFITAYGDDLVAVIANNDDMAIGAVNALKSAGKLGDIIVAGIDASDKGLQALEAGELACTVFQNPEQGAEALSRVNDAANDNPPKEKVTYIPFELVTKENIEKFQKK